VVSVCSIVRVVGLAWGVWFSMAVKEVGTEWHLDVCGCYECISVKCVRSIRVAGYVYVSTVGLVKVVKMANRVAFQVGSFSSYGFTASSLSIL